MVCKMHKLLNNIIMCDSIQKTQFRSKSILVDEGSPMEYKEGDGMLNTNFYEVEDSLRCNDLHVDDLQFFDLIEHDAEISDACNECEDFHVIGGYYV